MAYGAITSAYRTPAHNRFVGGVPNSHHLYGRALDVARRPGVTHRMIDEALRRAGFRLIESLDEGDHSHFAFADAVAPLLPVMAAKAPVVTAPPGPSAPYKPLRSVLADEHGTLIVADAVLAGSAPPASLAPGGQ